MAELTIIIPEEINPNKPVYKIRSEISRQIMDKLNRLNYQKQFAEDAKDIDKMIELDNQVLDLILIEMVLDPKITREQLRTNQIPMKDQTYLQVEIKNLTVLTPERIEDLKKKHSVQ